MPEVRERKAQAQHQERGLRKASIAIMAHNEEKNIAALLRRVLEEDYGPFEIDGVVVVSSGSSDRTDEIVAKIGRDDPRVVLVVQDRRYGKCAAINLFLREQASGDYVVLLSGDILPEPGALRRLLLPFLEKDVGMTGGRPVPVNDDRTFFGFACHLIWNIHHHVALATPKLGEAVAFKNQFDSIPEDLAVDEAALEAMTLEKGFKLVYCPDALIRNQGPDNLRDFLKQRRRIQVGHMDLRRKTGYQVSTYGFLSGLKALLAVLEWKPRFLTWTVLTCLLVTWGRVLGVMDALLLKRKHAVWDIAASTKGALSKNGVKSEDERPRS